jgi:iron complex transport system substrate-binding protein
MRVVSVLPSATEIVFALGHGGDLVGRSAECDYPAEVAGLPVVMRPRTLDAERPSREIDGRVTEARSRDESLYSLDIETLRALRPDLLLTQDLCGVCSVTSEEVQEACRVAGVAPRVLSLIPRTLTEVWETIPQVASALDDAPAGQRLADRLREAANGAHRSGTRPRVAVVEWLDPPILAGLWTSEMVELAGGETIGPHRGEVGERSSWSEIADRAPDLLVMSPCSFSVPRTLRELRDPALQDRVRRLAPRCGAFVADEAYFSRPGPRLAEGVRLVRGLIEGSEGRWPMPVARWSSTVEGTVPA